METEIRVFIDDFSSFSIQNILYEIDFTLKLMMNDDFRKKINPTRRDHLHPDPRNSAGK